MMKHLFLTLTAIFASVLASAQVTTIGDKFCAHVPLIDEDFIRDEVMMQPAGGKYKKCTITVTDSAFLAKSTVKEKTVKETIDVKYENGKPVSMKYNFESNLTSHKTDVKYEYDSKGVLITDVSFVFAPLMTAVRRYDLSADKRQSGETRWLPDGDQQDTSKLTIRYRSSGVFGEDGIDSITAVTSVAGSTSQRRLVSKKKEGDVVTAEYFGTFDYNGKSDSSVTTCIYTFDKNHRMVKAETNNNMFSAKSITTFVYDDRGLISGYTYSISSEQDTASSSAFVTRNAQGYPVTLVFRVKEYSLTYNFVWK